jgi:hypothetical protein
MRGPLAMAVILGASTLLPGCFEGKADLDLNPDGTGRIVGDLTFPLQPPWTGKKKEVSTRVSASAAATPPTVAAASPAAAAPAEETKAPEEQMKEVVYDILKRSSGIEAWRDVSFQLLPSGRVHFTGTAYFRDLSRVRIFPDTKTQISFHSDGGNAMMLVLNSPRETKDDRPRPGREVSEEELAKKMKEMRAAYQAARGRIALDTSGLKVTLAFRLPGAPSEVRGLEQEGNVLTHVTQGEKLIQALDSVFNDNATLTRMILGGERPASSGGQFDAALSKRFFGGQKGEAWARVMEPMRPRFDYRAEAEAARKAQPEMMAKLGLDKPKPARPPTATKPSDTPTKKPAPAPAKKPEEPAQPGKLPPINLPKDLPNIPTPIIPLM